VLFDGLTDESAHNARTGNRLLYGCAHGGEHGLDLFKPLSNDAAEDDHQEDGARSGREGCQFEAPVDRCQNNNGNGE